MNIIFQSKVSLGPFDSDNLGKLLEDFRKEYFMIPESKKYPFCPVKDKKRHSKGLGFKACNQDDY